MDTQATRFGSTAALIAGPIWMIYYAADAISGALGARLLDQEPFSSPLTIAFMALFNGAIVGFNLANLGLYSKLAGRSRGWGRAGLAFAGLAVAFVVAAYGAAALGVLRDGTFSGMAVVTTCLATTLMGVAVLRARALPGLARFLPLFVGTLTFPFIIAVASVFGLFLPDYALSEFPFAFAGCCWLVIGLAMRARRARREVGRAELAAA